MHDPFLKWSDVRSYYADWAALRWFVYAAPHGLRASHRPLASGSLRTGESRVAIYYGLSRREALAAFRRQLYAL